MKLFKPSFLRSGAAAVTSALTIAVLALFTITGLGACAPLLFSGAAVGVLMSTDRRTSGSQIEDEGIELRSASRIRDGLVDRTHVNIASYNRQVLLTGEVPTAEDKQRVEQIVSRVDNVRAVVNELAVMGNTSLTQRSSDALVTAKVKASMVDAKDLFANAFKVVTERGTTYLMGRVSQREADRATEIARGTSGVQKVVRIFETVSDEELKNLLPTPARGDAKK